MLYIGHILFILGKKYEELSSFFYYSKHVFVFC